METVQPLPPAGQTDRRTQTAVTVDGQATDGQTGREGLETCTRKQTATQTAVNPAGGHSRRQGWQPVRTSELVT